MKVYGDIRVHGTARIISSMLFFLMAALLIVGGLALSNAPAEAGLCYMVTNTPPDPVAGQTYDFTVKIGPSLSFDSTRILIDGVHKGNSTGGEIKTFTALQGTSHVVEVDSLIISSSRPGIRYSVDNPKQTASEDNLFIVFDYRTGAMIWITTDPPSITHDPLLHRNLSYTVGANFKPIAPASVNSANDSRVKYNFKQWSFPDGTSSPNTNPQYTVTAPGTFTAVYDTYYQFTMSTDNPSWSETYWYKSNTTPTYSFSHADMPMQDFWGALGGRLKAVNPTGTQMMNAPSTLKIMWSRDYTIPILVICVTVLAAAGMVFLFLRRRSSHDRIIAAAPAGPHVSKTRTSNSTDAIRVMPTGAEKEKKTRDAAKKTASSALPGSESNFCAECGTPIEKDSSFCTKCGAKL